MKIAILSDIHGNLTAFETVSEHIETWQPDATIINGDIVNRGPDSLACWQMATQKRAQQNWQIVRGNHEDYVLKHTRETPNAEHIGIRAAINQNSRWTYRQVNGCTPTLAALPDGVSLTVPDGSELRTRHATMRGNQDCMFPDMAADIVQQQIAPAPAVFVTSHIHEAYIRKVGDTLIVNSGSAGHHNAYDTRATYAQLSWQNGRWQAEIIRLPYDMAKTERAYYESGFMDETGPVAQLIFYEWKTAVPLLPMWRSKYMDAVLAGEISLESSVNKFLESNL
jgi:predicted phosphodiesterase